MATASCANCCDGRKPNRYVVSLAGTCCKCGTIATGSQPCGSCSENATQNDFDCSLLNGYFELTVDPLDPCHYVHQFPAGAPGNALSLDLRISDNAQLSRKTVNVCVSLSFDPDSEGNPVRAVSWGKTALKCCCHIGNLRRRTTNRKCCWPQQITVSPVPTPDLVSPLPGWIPSDPADLNNSPFWPIVDVDLMETSDFAPVRYSNGELQLRITDISSPAFGVPWGHTRIYSNRLSNSFDFGNGTNWLIHEWPRLVSLKTNRNKGKTGCAICILRGTRNALWFDEYSKGGTLTWQARYGAMHVLVHDAVGGLFTLYAPNGHQWEFYDFTPVCSRALIDKPDRDTIAPGCFKRHIGAYGESSQQLTAHYQSCRLNLVDREGTTVDENGTSIDAYESIEYAYFQRPDPNAGRIQYVTLTRILGSTTQNVLRAEYTYYEKNDSNGNLGDLKTAQGYFWKDPVGSNSNGWMHRENTLQYFAYYTDPNSTYCQGMLKAVVGPESYNMMRENNLDPVASGPNQSYSDLWIEYYSDSDVPASADRQTAYLLPRRIKTITIDRGGRAFSYKYRFSSPTASAAVNPATWHCETVETRPDGSTLTTYSNRYSETIAAVLEGDAQTWITFFTRNPYFPSMAQKATPAATDVLSFNANSNGTVTRSANVVGRYTTFNYQQTYVNRRTLYIGLIGSGGEFGGDGLSNDFHVYNYVARPGNAPLYFLTGDAGPALDLTFKYKWTATQGVQARTTIFPTVGADQYGNGQPAQSITTYDSYGFPIVVKDRLGITTQSTFYATAAAPQQITQTAAAPTKPASVLTSNFWIDHHGRIIKAQGPARSAVVNTVGLLMPVHRIEWTIHDSLNGAVISVKGYNGGLGEQIINPVEISFFDRSSRLVRIAAAIAPAGMSPGQLTVNRLTEGTYCRLREVFYDSHNRFVERRVYYDIASGSYYDEKSLQYDSLYRPVLAARADGTLVKTAYEARGLPTAVLKGTTTDSLATATEIDYDNGQEGGNGNPTTVTQYLAAGSSRVTSTQFNSLDQAASTSVESGSGLSESAQYDGAGRISQASLAAPNLPESVVVPSYDAMGNVYQRGYYERSAQLGAGAGQLSMYEWSRHDNVGNVVVERPAGGTAYYKTDFDGFGRQVGHYACTPWQVFFSPVPPLPTPGIGAADMVLEQLLTVRDEIGQPRVTIRSRQAQPSSDYNLFRGDLSSCLSARVDRAEVFYDPIGRSVAVVNYGSLGSNVPSIAIPGSTDSVLVTRNTYNQRGELAQIVDANGRTTSQQFDDAGRLVTRQVAGVRTIRFVYEGDDRISGVYLINPDGSSVPIAIYLYGEENALGMQWGFDDNGLIGMAVDAAGAATTFAYNLQGEITQTNDPRGVVHQFDRDVYSRLTHDRVVSAPIGQSDFDGSVRLIKSAYDGMGRLATVGTYSNPDETSGQLLTQVTRSFTFFGQMATESQQAFGMPAGVGIALSTAYQYTNDVPVNGPAAQTQQQTTNSIRQLAVRYPTGKLVAFEYAPLIGDAFSLVSGIMVSDDHGPAVNVNSSSLYYVGRYLYGGVGEIYSVRLVNSGTAPGIEVNLGEQFGAFSNLDSLGRIKAWSWADDRAGRPVCSTIGMYYNRRSQITNRTTVANVGKTQAGEAEAFGYDGLGRLQSYRRSAPAPNLGQQWNLDSGGNWTTFTETGSQTLSQQRTPGPGFRIGHIENSKGETQWAAPLYDAAGNTTQCPQPSNPAAAYAVKYDAWNRPTKIASDALTVGLTYDGLGRLLVKQQTVSSGSPTVEARRYAWSYDWRLLEEHVFQGPSPSYLVEQFRYEYVWGMRALDDLLCRDTYKGAGPYMPLNQRYYALSDAAGNTLGVFDGSLAYVFQYDGYGVPSGLSTDLDWRHLFAGYYYDPATGLYLVRNRVYHPVLGRWLQNDPAGMFDGPNPYEYCAGDPANLIDPTGEFAFAIPLIMLAIGLPSVFAARHGASEMEQAVNTGDAARYVRGQQWFGWGLLGTGTAITLPLGFVGGPAATWLGLGQESLAFSATSGAIGMGLEGAAFGGFVSGMGAYSTGASGVETLRATGEGAFWGGVTGAALGATFGAAGYGLGRIIASESTGFGARGFYRPPTGAADEAVRAAYLAEARSFGFRAKLFAHNVLTPGRKWITSEMVEERVSEAAFGRGAFSVIPLDDAGEGLAAGLPVQRTTRFLFGGEARRTLLNYQYYSHELIHVSQMLKNPTLIRAFPLRIIHEPIQLLTAHGELGWPILTWYLWEIFK